MSPIRTASRVIPRSVFTITATELIAEVGCTYRALDYWVRKGLVPVPQRRPGTGHPRFFGEEALFVTKVIHCLSGFGLHGDALTRAIREIRESGRAARVVYVKQDGSTDWTPGAVAAIVIDLDQFRLKSDVLTADR